MNSAPSTLVPFIRKITPKAVTELQGINLLQLPRPVVPRNLYDLFGLVHAVTIKADRSGTKADSVQFKGEFQAVNSETGEVICDSGVFFIPVMDSVLYAAVKNAQDVDDKARVAVALRVAIRTAPADKPSMTGYEFDVQRLIPQTHAEDSPIERLKKLARQSQMALAGPAAGTLGNPAPTPANGTLPAEGAASEAHKARPRGIGAKA